MSDRQYPRTRDFRDLVVWQRAMTVVRMAYAIARRLPVEERFELASQIRRAASAVPLNIAEGHSSPYRRVFLVRLRTAHSSLKELENGVLIVDEAGYIDRETTATILAASDEVSRLIRAMRTGLDEPPPRSSLRAPRSARDPTQHTASRNRSQS